MPSIRTAWARMGRPLAWALVAAAATHAQVSPTIDSPSELAKSFAKKARKAAKKGEASQAYILYSEAAALQPNKLAYRARMEALQSRALRETKPGAAAPASRSPDSSVPVEHVFDNMTQREIAQARPLEGAQRLKPLPGSQEIDLSADPRMLWDSIAKRFGLEAVYDGDYPKTGTPVRLRLDRADYRDALRAAEAATGSFVIPLSARIFMVAKDTPQKRQELEQTITLAVRIPDALTTQELTEIAQAVRQVTDVQKIAWDSADSQIVLRDRVSRATAAEALLDQLVSSRAEALIELEYLEVSDSDIAHYGFDVTRQFEAHFLEDVLKKTLNIPSGFTNFVTFGGGRTLIGLTAAQVQALFNATISSSRILYHSQVRAQSGQAVTFHAGERYPVVTAGYYGSVPANQQSQVYTPPPTFSYEDLGIQMKMTPHVHGMDEMTVSLETAFEVLTGQANNGIPIIGNRKVKTDARVRNDEWTVVAGVSSSSRSKSIDGWWGLSDAPILGNLFKSTSTDKESSYVLIGIRPHLLSLPADQTATKAIAFGTETHAVTPL